MLRVLSVKECSPAAALLADFGEQRLQLLDLVRLLGGKVRTIFSGDREFESRPKRIKSSSLNISNVG